MKWLWVSAAIIVLDQATKRIATTALSLHEPISVLPFFNLTLTYNPGAAFSFLSDAGGWQRWLFTTLSILVSAFIIVWLRRIPRGQIWVPCALALILGGALGNLWDRLVLGMVVDFFDVYFRQWHWPAFNVADSAICVGAAILIVAAFEGGEKNQA